MERGSKNRTIAATQMNNTSSRAHTVITITLTQNLTTNGTKTSRKSIINLVDLAGS
jgi:kinesin family protein 1